jgi:hypothetical protein
MITKLSYTQRLFEHLTSNLEVTALIDHIVTSCIYELKRLAIHFDVSTIRQPTSAYISMYQHMSAHIIIYYPILANTSSYEPLFAYISSY